MKKVQLILLAFLMISLASCKSAKYKNLDDGLYADKKEVIPDKIWKILSGLTTKGGTGVVHLIRA
jgi:hypothetical protein